MRSLYPSPIRSTYKILRGLARFAIVPQDNE
jgi:hypothetical protein